MLTKEENEFLTRVGPGTPAGELFRRYWLPVETSANLGQYVRGGTGPRLAAGLALAGLLVPPPLLYLLSQAAEGLYQPKFQARYLVLFAPLMALLLALAPSALVR